MCGGFELRIALDATPLTLAAGGLRRYTEELACALVAQFPEDRYFLMSDQPFPPIDGLVAAGGASNALARRWWGFGLPYRLATLGINLFHGTDFAVPYLPVRPAVMTVHDLSPWRPGGESSARVRERTPRLLRMGLAAMVITPTEAIRREVIAYFGLRPDRVEAVHEAASAVFRPHTPPPAERPYFLCVGNAASRKNIAFVEAAWRAAAVDAPLVIAGEGHSEPGGPIYTGHVSDAALAGLYSGALALLYPSSYEGFGLPVLEAMQCGTMAITSRDAAVTEVAGGAAIQVDSGDARGWAEALRVACDEPARATWRERGLRRARLFSWEKTAVRTREVYARAIERQ